VILGVVPVVDPSSRGLPARRRGGLTCPVVVPVVVPIDPTFCCAWGEDENCKSRDEEWEDEDAMKREVDALLALVVVLLVVVGALILYLVPWRRRAAFASPSLSVELNPTTYNELGRSVEGI
jgi:hypothetical protein